MASWVPPPRNALVFVAEPALSEVEGVGDRTSLPATCQGTTSFNNQLCIRARLQSCRNRPQIKRALAPEEFLANTNELVNKWSCPELSKDFLMNAWRLTGTEPLFDE